MLLDLIRYFAWVIVDGDWLNDWLTHLPVAAQPWVIELGKEVAQLLS
jgi:hypothetical protein